MAVNLYDISNWNSTTTYSIDGIVKNGNYYYYSLVNSNLNNTPSTTSTSWGGMAVHTDGNTRPKFLWTPNYGTEFPNNPKLKTIQFGDGYKQISNDGINNNLLIINLTFDLRTQTETTAILHFLDARKGSESFVFTAPPPYNKSKLFTCKQWNSIYNFYNNYRINATFEENLV